jgi:zinc/manganese transport system ATP-binding protein
LIAQALAPAPDLLLLDEPLDSLDLPNQAAVAALIARSGRSQGLAVMIVMHDVNPVLSHLNTVVYLAPSGRGSALPAR